jgi:hypothetical protein
LTTPNVEFAIRMNSWPFFLYGTMSSGWLPDPRSAIVTPLTCAPGFNALIGIKVGLHALRAELTRQWKIGTPWHAHAAFETLAMLDLPSWVALLGLTGELAVLLPNVCADGGSRLRSIDPSAFTFISERSQIVAAHEFLRSLPDALSR